jgi:hypothetical protein
MSNAAHAAELFELGLAGDLCHVCIGADLSRLRLAKDLRLAGLVIVEDSPLGPMVTRTWTGSEALRAIAQSNHVDVEKYDGIN